MPRRDGTGPMGRGAMTGRGLGLCTEANTGRYGAGLAQGYGHGLGLGFGQRMGLGFGCRRGFGGFFVRDTSGLTEKEILSQQKEFFQNRLAVINRRLESN